MSQIGWINRASLAIDLLRKVERGELVLDEVRAFLKKYDEAEAKSQRERDERNARRAKRGRTGRKASGAFEIAPASEQGCDHGATGIILLRKGGQRLVWRSGSKYFSGIGMQSYAPADLEILRPDDRMPEKVTDNHTADLRGEKKTVARLSKALILLHADQIDAAFGKGAAARAAELKGTVVL